MADSLKDLLGAKDFSEPTEVKVIKQFVADNFKSACSVSVGPRQIVISVNGASLAGALRIRLHDLQALCQTDKRLLVRIS